MNNNNHKDAKPLETVKFIRQQLNQVNIFLVERVWFEVSDTCVSTSTYEINYPKMSTNGKGVGKEFALASSYAEFMERLQNGLLLQNFFGLKKNRFLFSKFPDEKNINLKVLMGEDKNKHLSSILNNLNLQDINNIYGHSSFETIPFYSVFEEKVFFLPSKLLYQTITSNGMCAGNSFSEAIVQGISEIFERYAIKEIIYQNVKQIPTILQTEIDSNKAREMIHNIENLGFKIIIKDFSLKGTIPVVAIIIFSPDRTKYRVSVGSDPNFEVALQRCLTEVFQGLDENSIKRIMLPFRIKDDFTLEEKNKEFAKAFTTGTGEYPASIFLNTPSSLVFKKAFDKPRSNNREYLKFYLKRLQKLNYNLLIRDNSFLGFPSYSIYIPGLSEIINNDYNRQKLSGKRPQMRKLFLNLNTASKHDISTLEKYLDSWEKLVPFSYDKNKIFAFLSGISYSRQAPLNMIFHYNIFRVIIAYANRNYKNMLKHLQFILTNNINKEYWACFYLYIQLEKAGLSHQKIIFKLGMLYDEKLLLEITNYFHEKISDNYLSNFGFPSCQEETCSGCQINNSCHYKSWQQISKAYYSKIENIVIPQETIKLKIQEVYNV